MVVYFVVPCGVCSALLIFTSSIKTLANSIANLLFTFLVVWMFNFDGPSTDTCIVIGVSNI